MQRADPGLSPCLPSSRTSSRPTQDGPTHELKTDDSASDYRRDSASRHADSYVASSCPHPITPQSPMPCPPPPATRSNIHDPRHDGIERSGPGPEHPGPLDHAALRSPSPKFPIFPL